MVPAFLALDNLSGPSLSNAISQTLPVLAGAASQASYATQRAVRATVTSRLDDFHGLGSGVAAERNAWIRPLGGVASQDSRDGGPGYRASGGGLVAGVDGAISPRAIFGGSFAYSHQQVTGSEDTVPNRLGVDSYLLGLAPMRSGRTSRSISSLMARSTTTAKIARSRSWAARLPEAIAVMPAMPAWPSRS